MKEKRATHVMLSSAVSLLAYTLIPGALQAGDVGDVAVVEDDGTVLTDTGGIQMLNLAGAGKIFYPTHADSFDFLHVFTTKDMGFFGNVGRGEIVKNATKGIGVLPAQTQPSNYGSAGRLLHAVSMGYLGTLPDDPDSPVPILPFVSGVQYLAHETGHYWGIGVRYDLGDATGLREDLRGVNKDHPPDEPFHWSYYFGSGPSVMYGNVLEDSGGGAFMLKGDANRTFSALDQYVMGLRPAESVGPFFLGVPDPSLTYGSQTLPLKPGASDTLNGTVRRVTIEDILRAEGPRVPPYGEAQCHFRDAFVLVVPKGGAATAAQIARVERYRTRWAEFFDAATEGRGSVDTTLDGRLSPGACENGFDGGFDAGEIVDAAIQDAGAVDAGVADGDSTPDAEAVEDAAAVDGAIADGDSGNIADVGGVPGDDARNEETDSGGKKPAVSAGEGDAGGCGCATVRL